VRFLRWPLRILGLLAVLYVYFATLHPHERVADHVYFSSPAPWAIAHRGGRGLWPENTLLAFEKADALGVDVLEMDLRVTADGAIVVIHDASVDRTTNGHGRIDVMTLDEVRALDAGYKFRNTAGEYFYRGKGVRIPTIEEVLSRFGTRRLNIEMKEFEPHQAAQLCRLFKQRGVTDRVLIASFGSDAMAAFRDECPTVATSATLREGMMLYYLDRLRLGSIYRGTAVAVQTPERFGRQQFLSPHLLETAAAYNVKVQVWTVNEEADMRRLLRMGVQGILTDYPDRLLKLMGRSR
jgi:glycerophosphoryl diester phosphodiesterase